MLIFAQRYKAFFDSTADGILVFNLENQILDVNPRFINISGYSFDKLVSSGIEELFDKDSVNLLHRKIKKLLTQENKNRYPFECNLVNKRSKKKSVEIGLSLLKNQYGYSKTILALVRDITSRKEAEENLIQRAKELQRVFDAVPTMLCVIDDSKKVKKINLEGIKSLKKQEKDIIGKKIGTIINCKYTTYSKGECGLGEKCSECSLCENILKCLKNDEIIRDVEVSIIITNDNTEYTKYFQLNAIPLRTHGKIWGVISLKDITAKKTAEFETEHLHKNIEQSNIELKKALDDLARSQSQLIESQKLQQIGLLSFGLAHNIKTPMAGIKGYAQLLHEKYPDSDEIQIILDEVKLIDEIINDLMLKSRKEHSNQREYINLNEVIHLELNFLDANLFFKHNIKKIIDLEEDLPLISGIYTHFSQSLMNIIQNSIDAMYDTDKKILKIKSYHNKSNIIIEIEDTGNGIPDNIKNLIFEPFFTTKMSSFTNNDNKPVGTGLGLSSASYFIHQYGGNIDISSTEGKGTKVTISIPYTSQEKRSCHNSVIIIDESQEMVDIFIKICQDMGIKAKGTTQGGKAFTLYKEIKPALIIVDLSLPKFNVKDFSRRVRKLHPEQKVLFMKGYTDNSNISNWLSQQNQEPLLSSVIKKPFSLDEFRRVVKRMLF